MSLYLLTYLHIWLGYRLLYPELQWPMGLFSGARQAVYVRRAPYRYGGGVSNRPGDLIPNKRESSTGTADG